MVLAAAAILAAVVSAAVTLVAVLAAAVSADLLAAVTSADLRLMVFAQLQLSPAGARALPAEVSAGQVVWPRSTPLALECPASARTDSSGGYRIDR